MWDPPRKRSLLSRRDLRVAAVGLAIGALAILWFIAPELTPAPPGVDRHMATL